MTSQPAPPIKQRRPLSPEAIAYLEQERDAETKSEFHGGTIVAMAGASYNHCDMVSILSGEFYQQRKSHSCKALSNEMRVYVEECESYFYPDLVVICGSPELTAGNPPSLCNPQIIVEILSDSTENLDRGYKAGCYRTLPSLQEYLLIAQNRVEVEHYVRQSDTIWMLKTITDIDERLTFMSCVFSIPLSVLYSGGYTL